MNARVHLLVSGRVQGVFFRANTRQFASGLGLKGWVRNLPDGNVEVLAEGRKNALDRFIEFCRKGPEGANIENIDVRWGSFMDEFGDFEVRV